MQKLSWMIENEINFGNIINLLKLQISDAISYYQSNNENINKRISLNCLIKTNANNRTRIIKKKKIISTVNSLLKALQHNSNKMSDINKKLVDIIDVINKNYVGLSNFWNSLPLKSCKSISGYPEKCWNGAILSK